MKSSIKNPVCISLITSAVAVVFAVSTLSSCGKKQSKTAAKTVPDSTPSGAPQAAPASPAAQQTVNTVSAGTGSNDLVGSWVSNCIKVEDLNLREKIVIQVDGKVEKITQEYLEETCETAVQAKVENGTAAFGAWISASENIKAVDLNVGTFNSQTIYQQANGKLCFGDVTSAHTKDNRPSQISCSKNFQRE